MKVKIGSRTQSDTMVVREARYNGGWSTVRRDQPKEIMRETGNHHGLETSPARPQPDGQRPVRGKLKVFLGYAAGVGKTYALLEAARERRAAGIDVVAGCVDTHGRPELEALLEGMEVVPGSQAVAQGAMPPDLNLDAVIARRPQLVLVDDLAHTNAPGARHIRRYQDVEELLSAGLDVYTTLNIQHVESLTDIVAQITGVAQRESVPDRLLDLADEILVIDLPPAELIERLRAGKVHIPSLPAQAIEQFFRPGNLAALRELALRRAAARVDEQMRAYMQTRAIPGPWPAGERLLVCIGPGPLSERLVRTTRRLAEQLRAEWVAVYVETAGHSRLTDAGRAHVARTLQLAEELGGKSVMLPGESVVDSVLAYARQHNITQIVIGRPRRSRGQEWLRRSPADRLLRECGPIDVYVINSEPVRGEPARRSGWWQAHSHWTYYLWSAALVALATLIGWPFHTVIAPANLVMLYLAAVLVAAIYLGRGPSILASVLSVLVFDFFLIEPRLTLAVNDTEYLITFLGLLVVGLVISELATRAREQARAALQREAQTAALYALSRDLAAAGDLEGILQTVVAHIGETFGRASIVLLPEASEQHSLARQAGSPGFRLEEEEQEVATWAFQHGQPAGQGTDTLPSVAARFLPLRTARGVVGVLGVRPPDPDRHPIPAQRQLLEAFASQTALAIERAQLSEAARQTEVLQATEKFQSALLNSVSHDLRTPLVSITGALSSLQEDEERFDPDARRALLENAREEVERLNRLVGNLLDMTRLAAGALHPRLEPCDVQDLVGSALEQMRGRLQGRPLAVSVPDEVPLIPVDEALLVQVLVNLLDNALKYSPPGSPLEISARRANDAVEIRIADRGLGIPPEDLTRVFDKFYRVQHPAGGRRLSGTGLGLSICQGIVEVHGGRIWAENRAGGGTAMTFVLPVQGIDPAVAAKGGIE